MKSYFDARDIHQIKQRGINLEKIQSQLEAFEKGFPFIKLKRPCTAGDGITIIPNHEISQYIDVYEKAASIGRATKFVPASGAASRMFKQLLTVYNHSHSFKLKDVEGKSLENNGDYKFLLHFIKNLPRFAFYDDLYQTMIDRGKDLPTLITKGHYQNILAALLTEEGLNYANLPKGLIKFHRYEKGSRTAFEEHLVEAVAYVRDKDGVARIHFTVPVEHKNRIQDFFQKVQGKYQKSGVRFDISYSIQKPSTDTIAVDLKNEPFRDSKGALVFRPGGHGALLENLNDLGGDIVFIKNIDNIVPDWLKPETHKYKCFLAGILVTVQNDIFTFLEQLSQDKVEDSLLKCIQNFLESKLCIAIPPPVKNGNRGEKVKFFFNKLNRPLRICGMVKNEGEPGGGPFWVEDSEGNISIQIVEAAQVDMSSPEQRSIWESSTHFNPVDLVCGVRDFRGQPFHLLDFVDPDTGFISIKSQEGRELKALELPGLWNGSMADWNTIFVEVPISTFNPVKTVFDLLRNEHQPQPKRV